MTVSDEYDGAGEALYTEADVRAAAELARAQASEVYRVALRVGALGGLSADVVLKALEPAPMPAAQPADDSEGEYTTDEIVAAALELADSDEHPAGALEALAEKLHVGKAWDESKHKRDHGKFSSTGGSGAGSDAKTAGGNKPGKRALKAQKRAEAVQAASALMAQRAKGKPLSHGEAKELLDHMAHLTHDDLRALRKEHGSTFRGERVKGSRVDALVKWARGEDYTRRRGKRGSALQQVVDYGGLDPNSADFKRFYGSMRDAVNDGVPMAAFKRGGQGLDELAAEMVAAGHISIPDWEDPAEHLVGLLRGRKLLHHAADEGHEGRYAEHVAGQLEGDDGGAKFDPNKQWDDEDPDWFSKAAPLPDDDTHTPAELLAAAVDVAQRALADGTDPEDGLHALYELAHGDTVQKAWDKDKHPRDDHGRFVSKDAIQAAKSDPKKAAELKKRVTNPEQRKKLDAALEDKEVIGTKRGLAKHETAQKREKVQADRNRARELRIKLADQESRGEELNPDDLREIVPHLATMTHEELSRMRSMLERSGATFGGKRLRADRVAALTQWALDKAAGKTDTPAPEGKPEAESGSGAGESQPARTGSVADILRDVRGTMQITQPRAKPGGEEGPNGEWYPAGAFIATQDLPKRLKDKLKRQATGRVRVRNGLEVPQPGQMSIADKLGGTVMNPRDGSINEQYLDYIKASAEDRQMYAELAEKYKAGGDWVSVNDYPSLARLEDAARLLAAGKPVPGAVLAVLPAEYRERLQKWTPPTLEVKPEAESGSGAGVEPPGADERVRQAGRVVGWISPTAALVDTGLPGLRLVDSRRPDRAGGDGPFVSPGGFYGATIAEAMDKARQAYSDYHEKVRSANRPESAPPPGVAPISPVASVNGTDSETLAHTKPLDDYLGDEYQKLPADVRKRAKVAASKGKRIPEVESAESAIRERHRAAVVDALAQGKPVPAEVLADYPDLAAKYAKPDAPAPEVKPEAESVSGAGGASDEDILQRALSPSGSRIEDTEHPRYQQIVRAAERAQQEVRGRLSAVSKRFRELMDPDGSLGIADSGASASYHIAQAVRGALAGKPLGSRGVIGDESGKLLPVARGMSAEKPTGLVNARARKLAAELGTPIVPLLVKGENDEPKGWALVQSPVEFPKGVEFANTIPAGAIDTGDVLFSSAALPKDFRNGMLLPFDNSLDFGTLPLARKYAKPEESGSAAAPAADQDAEDARRAKQHHEAKFSGPVRDEIREYRKLGMDPGTINSGECLPFAQRVIAAIRKKGQQAEFGAPKGDLHHVWVVANGKHYDAQHPDGVDDPKDLTFFQDNPELLSRGWASTPNEPVSDRLARGENVAANIAQDAVAPVPRGTVRTAADTGKPPKTRLQAQAERARAANPPPDPNQEFGTPREQYQAFLRYAHPDDPAQKPDPGAVAEYLSKLPDGAREKLDQHFATAGKSLAQVEAFHRARMAEATPEPTPRATSEQPAPVPAGGRGAATPADPQAELAKIPPGARHAVEWALAGLQEHADKLAGARNLDSQFRGNGRYEREVNDKGKEFVAARLARLAQFRELAAKNGVDADAVIAALGGIPNHEPSPTGANYRFADEPDAAPRAEQSPQVKPASGTNAGRTPELSDQELSYRKQEQDALDGDPEALRSIIRSHQDYATRLRGGYGDHTPDERERKIRHHEAMADSFQRDLEGEEFKVRENKAKIEADILDHLDDNSGFHTAHDIGRGIGLTRGHVRSMLESLAREGAIYRTSDPHTMEVRYSSEPPPSPKKRTPKPKPEPVPGGAPKAPDVSALKRNPRADLDHIERLKGQYPEGAIEREWLDVAKGNAAGVATRDNSALAALHGGDKQHGARHYVLERLASAAAQAHKDGDAAGHTATTNAVTGLGGTLHGAAPGETIAHDPAMYDHPEGAFSGDAVKVTRQPVTYRGALVYRGQVEPVGTGAQPPTNGSGTSAATDIDTGTRAANTTPTQAGGASVNATSGGGAEPPKVPPVASGAGDAEKPVDLRNDDEARFQASRVWGDQVRAAADKARAGGAEFSALDSSAGSNLGGTGLSVHDLLSPGRFFAMHVNKHGTAPTAELLDRAVQAAIAKTAEVRAAKEAQKQAQAADDLKANRVRSIPAYRNNLVREHRGRLVKRDGDWHAEFPTAAARSEYLAAARAADAAHQAKRRPAYNQSEAESERELREHSYSPSAEKQQAEAYFGRLKNHFQTAAAVDVVDGLPQQYVGDDTYIPAKPVRGHDGIFEVGDSAGSGTVTYYRRRADGKYERLPPFGG